VVVQPRIYFENQFEFLNHEIACDVLRRDIPLVANWDAPFHLRLEPNSQVAQQVPDAHLSRRLAPVGNGLSNLMRLSVSGLVMPLQVRKQGRYAEAHFSLRPTLT
jgi:hypothetical protein